MGVLGYFSDIVGNGRIYRSVTPGSNFGHGVVRTRLAHFSVTCRNIMRFLLMVSYPNLTCVKVAIPRFFNNLGNLKLWGCTLFLCSVITVI